MNNFKDQKRGGYYFKDNTPYVSVTRVLEIIDKPALRYWFGKQVYKAMVVNPSISEQEALSAPYAASDKAKNRGSAVHSVVEAYKAGTAVTQSTEELQPFINAFFEWANNNHIKIISQEKTVFSKKYGYAGTYDLLATLNGGGKNILIDVKTNKDGTVYPEAFLQLSAYKHALEEEGQKTDQIAVLALSSKGTFTFQTGQDCFEAFLNAKALWEWKNPERLSEKNS